MIGGLRKYKRQMGLEFPLEKNDLCAYLNVRPYWVESGPNMDRAHRTRFHGVQTCQVSWVIALDSFPELGYRGVDDEEWDTSFIKPDGSRYTCDEWIDPRRGDLFALIDSLKSQQTSNGKQRIKKKKNFSRWRRRQRGWGLMKRLGFLGLPSMTSRY